MNSPYRIPAQTFFAPPPKVSFCYPPTRKQLWTLILCGLAGMCVWAYVAVHNLLPIAGPCGYLMMACELLGVAGFFALDRKPHHRYWVLIGYGPGPY